MLKDIPGYEGKYKVSMEGDVYSFTRHTSRILKPDNRKGYLSVTLSKNGKLRRVGIHRLVALTWLPNPDSKPYVNHIDLNKHNNSLSNLEWVTLSENCKHAYAAGALDAQLTKAKKLNNARRKVSDQQTATTLIGHYLLHIEEVGYRTIFHFTCKWCGTITSARADAQRIRNSPRCTSHICRKKEHDCIN